MVGRSRNFTVYKSQPSGMGLVEVMGIIAIMTILTMGVSSMVLGAYKSQKQANIAQTLSMLRDKFQNSIMNEVAWSQTLNDPAFACMAAASCAAGAQTIDTLYSIDNAGAAVIFYDTSAANAGFDVNGQPCATFNPNPGLGDNACPIRYTMTWTPMCNGAACGAATYRPDVQVNFTLLFNPANSDDFFPINAAHYNLQFQRRKVTNQLRVVLSEVVATANVNAPTRPCGPRDITQEDYDANELAALVGGGRFSLIPGTYQCKVKVPAYRAGAVTATLTDITNARQVGSANASTTNPTNTNAGLWSGDSQAEAVIFSSFKIMETATFAVGMTCEFNHARAGGRPVINGVGVFDFTQLTQVECVRTD